MGRRRVMMAGVNRAFVRRHATTAVVPAIVFTTALVTTVKVGKGPQGVAVDPTTHTVYVTNAADDTVSVIG